VDKVLTILGVGGIILSAIYLLWVYERVFTGPQKVPHADRASLWKDLSFRELAALVPLLIMAVVIGVYPKPFLSRIEPSVRQAIHQASTEHPAPPPGTAAGKGLP